MSLFTIGVLNFLYFMTTFLLLVCLRPIFVPLEAKKKTVKITIHKIYIAAEPVLKRTRVMQRQPTIDQASSLASLNPSKPCVGDVMDTDVQHAFGDHL